MTSTPGRLTSPCTTLTLTNANLRYQLEDALASWTGSNAQLELEKVAAASPFFRASAVLIELPQSLA